jgi:hypothetical protein
MNIDQNRHENAMNVYIERIIDDTVETKVFAETVRDRQWSIVAKEKFDMNDAFTIAVERLTK